MLLINTNTTFNSTVSVLFCTATHMLNVLHPHTDQRQHDNYCAVHNCGRTMSKFKKKNLIFLYIIILHILIYKNKTTVNFVVSQISYQDNNQQS